MYHKSTIADFLNHSEFVEIIVTFYHTYFSEFLFFMGYYLNDSLLFFPISFNLYISNFQLSNVIIVMNFCPIFFVMNNKHNIYYICKSKFTSNSTYFFE